MLIWNSESMVRKAGNQPKVDENTVILQSCISQAFAAIGSQHTLRKNYCFYYYFVGITCMYVRMYVCICTGPQR